MKILVTGGAGFIGSHLCDRLISEGHSVVVVDNFSLGKEENIAHLLKNDEFNLYKEDILNYELMRKIFQKEKIELVFHLAANSDISISNKQPEIDLNKTFMTTINTLNLMREFNVKKIVFASTSAIYGETGEKIKEDFGPLFPVSHYGAAKLASEAFISSYVNNYSMQAWIIRFPNVVGERATHGAVFDFINKLKKNSKELEVLGNGEQNKPYLYVKDLIEAIIFIWKKTDDKINFYNVGVNNRTKVKDMAKIVIEEMNVPAKIKYLGGERGWIGDVTEFKYDLKKINNLGWKAKISSDEAVRKSVRYILKKD